MLVNVDGGAPGRTERPRPGGPLPDGWTDLIPELDRQPERHRRDQADMGRIRQHRSRKPAEARGVTQVVIAGVATGTGVESTARQAYEAGFNVTLATDAMTDPPRGARLQHRKRLPAARRERLDAGDHRSAGNTERLT